MIEISSITQLPSDWCDILTKSYDFVATACTKAKHTSDPNWQDPTLEKKSEHIYYDPTDDGWLIVVEEEQITEEILPKYIEELNKHSSEQYAYNSNPTFFC